MKRKIKNILRRNIYILRLGVIIYNFIGLNRIFIIGKKNKIHKRFSFLKTTKIRIVGDLNNITLSKNVRLNNCKISINGMNNKIILDEEVCIRDLEVSIEDDNNMLIIGKFTEMYGGHIGISEDNSMVKIGENCLFSKDLEIRNGDSHTIIDLETNKRINHAKNIEIGNHVWAGAHVRILKGSNIKENVIIANSAVITNKSYEGNIIIGGCPAKVLKTNVNWSKERIE